MGEIEREIYDYIVAYLDDDFVFHHEAEREAEELLKALKKEWGVG